MRPKFLFLIALISSNLLFASSTICSSANLYYSAVRGDFGTQPPPNTVLGKTTFVYDGKVLLTYQDIQGLNVHGAPPYRFSLIGEAKVLAQEGSQISGSKVFEQVGELWKVDSLNPTKQKKIASEQVLCRHTWKFVP